MSTDTDDPNDAPILDRSFLFGTFDMTEPDQRAVLRSVLQTFRIRVEVLREILISDQDIRRIQKAAHDLKGLSGTLGGLRLSGTCDRLQSACKSAQPTDPVPEGLRIEVLDQLSELVPLVLAELRSLGD